MNGLQIIESLESDRPASHLANLLHSTVENYNHTTVKADLRDFSESRLDKEYEDLATIQQEINTFFLHDQ